jgi:protein TonB
MLLITELKNDTIVLSTSIQNLFFARQLMYRYGAIFDSMNIVLNNDFLVMEKKLQIINRTYFETELYYRENGPKGFNAYYARYFPNAFPTPKQDGVAHADFGPVNNEVGNEDAYAPPPREEDEVFEIIDVPAEFPGGVQALRKFIQDNMIYPEVAREMGYQGKCYLKFVVSKSGTISNVVVKKGVPDCPECDKEAIRIIRLSPKWKPAENSGLPVNSYYTLPISFKL